MDSTGRTRLTIACDGMSAGFYHFPWRPSQPARPGTKSNDLPPKVPSGIRRSFSALAFSAAPRTLAATARIVSVCSAHRHAALDSWCVVRVMQSLTGTYHCNIWNPIACSRQSGPGIACTESDRSYLPPELVQESIVYDALPRQLSQKIHLFTLI